MYVKYYDFSITIAPHTHTEWSNKFGSTQMSHFASHHCFAFPSSISLPHPHNINVGDYIQFINLNHNINVFTFWLVILFIILCILNSHYKICMTYFRKLYHISIWVWSTKYWQKCLMEINDSTWNRLCSIESKVSTFIGVVISFRYVYEITMCLWRIFEKRVCK